MVRTRRVCDGQRESGIRTEHVVLPINASRLDTCVRVSTNKHSRGYTSDRFSTCEILMAGSYLMLLCMVFTRWRYSIRVCEKIFIEKHETLKTIMKNAVQKRMEGE